MANVSSIGYQAPGRSIQGETPLFQVKGEDGQPILGRDGQPVHAFEKYGMTHFVHDQPTYLPAVPGGGTTRVEAARSVTLAHPPIGNTYIPALAIDNNLPVNLNAFFPQGQHGSFLNTQYVERCHMTRGIHQGVFQGRQVMAQLQPTVLMGGALVDRSHYIQHCVSSNGPLDSSAGEGGLATLPVTDNTQRSVQFYDIRGRVIPIIYHSLSSYAALHQGLSGAYQDQVSGSAVSSIAVAPEPQPVLSVKGGLSLSSQESKLTVVEGREASRQLMGEDSSKMNKRRRRRGRNRQTEVQVSVNPSVRHQSVTSGSVSVDKHSEVGRIKEDLEMPLSEINGMEKKLHQLHGSMNKEDLGLFVTCLEEIVASIDNNKAQHVWFSFKELELQLLVNARVRLYQLIRSCPKEGRKINLLQAERIFSKLDPVISRAFEGFLDKINEGVSKLLFETLDLLLMDFIMGVKLTHVDLGKLVPFVHRIPLAMSAELACKIACNLGISLKDKNDLVVKIYQNFIERLDVDGCIILLKTQVRHCFSQFSSAFITLPIFLFHERKYPDGKAKSLDKDVWLERVDNSEKNFISRYEHLRGKQLSVRWSKLENEILNEDEEDQIDEVLITKIDSDGKKPETSSGQCEAQVRLSNEEVCDRACELFRCGNTAEARCLYENILKSEDVISLISINCMLALIEVEFKELCFDRDYLNFRKIVRKSDKIFNDYRNAYLKKGYQLETKACELEQVSDEADKKIKQFYKKWSATVYQQRFTIDELKDHLASISGELSADDLDKLNWYLKEVEKLHKSMGDILPLLVLSISRLDQAFDDRQSWLSGIPSKVGGEHGECEATQSLSLSASDHQERLRFNGQMLDNLVCHHMRLQDELAALKQEEPYSRQRGSSV